MCDTIIRENCRFATRAATLVERPPFVSRMPESLHTSVSFFVPCATTAAMTSSGEPQPRKPPTCTVMPSLTSAAAAVADITGLFTTCFSLSRHGFLDNFFRHESGDVVRVGAPPETRVETELHGEIVADARAARDADETVPLAIGLK